MGLQRRCHAAKLTKHVVAWGIGKTIINLDNYESKILDVHPLLANRIEFGFGTNNNSEGKRRR